ncbi:MAG: pyridoxamine 5'-phosphate oxidase family protein [Thermoleophilia bacterium]
MAHWTHLQREHPEFAGRVLEHLEAGRHKTLATIRADGAPRISGSEVFLQEGDLWFGVMPGAMRVRDLQRDPRCAVHSASADPEVWRGDATVTGRAVEVTDPGERDRVMALRGGPRPEGPFHLFRIDITEALTVRMGDPADHLIVETWREGRGVRTSTRR